MSSISTRPISNGRRDLEQQRKRAKELLNGINVGEPAALSPAPGAGGLEYGFGDDVWDGERRLCSGSGTYRALGPAMFFCGSVVCDFSCPGRSPCRFGLSFLGSPRPALAIGFSEIDRQCYRLGYGVIYDWR